MNIKTLLWIEIRFRNLKFDFKSILCLCLVKEVVMRFVSIDLFGECIGRYEIGGKKSFHASITEFIIPEGGSIILGCMQTFFDLIFIEILFYIFLISSE